VTGVTDSTLVDDDRIRDVRDPRTRGPALAEAVQALASGALIVLPTDTVYGVGADAANPEAVHRLLKAKGRAPSQPPPVLVADLGALDSLACEVPADARALAEVFWPGALTLVVRAQPSLVGDLGEADGTVALRMPDDEIARELVRRAGPLAVSSANRTGYPAATTAGQAFDELGMAVELYLDAGPSPGGEASTVVDAVTLRVLRPGAISVAELREVVQVQEVDR